MLDGLLEMLENDEDTMLMYPASSQTIARTQKNLKEMNLPLVPKEYLDFLHLSNGLIYGNDVLFFGTEEVEEERLPSLLDANATFMEKQEANNILLIGRSGDDSLTYNGAKGTYDIIDKSGDTVEEFDSFFDMLSEFCDDEANFYEDDMEDFDFEDDNES